MDVNTKIPVNFRVRKRWLEKARKYAKEYDITLTDYVEWAFKNAEDISSLVKSEKDE